MAAAPSNIAPAAASIPGAGVSEFRLGEDKISDHSDSDGDQSEHTQRSLSPQSGAKPSKTKKKKARRQVGALTDELDTLLGAAFQAPNGEAVKSDVPGNIDQTVTMEVDTEKRLPKRTRQNMAKMEKRKLAREGQKQSHPFQQPAPAQQKPLTVEGQKKQQQQSKRNSTKVRRERKEKSRTRRALGLGDEMAVD